ncbi:hypothetical protein HYPSUDRAFT_630462 [Hypholoma sublateritium FD-334 SS-4]|uniref:Uncharacterized protein n=1 Tax=Hypholoma sublateritium (strain FD-334 SS-4) TaxID=945553 RepID=A0A0D2LLW0_HYPSF|nr:hypothetical protein HYPSUDRAFT_630462 [Hypholoma sublateritium FD-334 SS-4]
MGRRLEHSSTTSCIYFFMVFCVNIPRAPYLLSPQSEHAVGASKFLKPTRSVFRFGLKHPSYARGVKKLPDTSDVLSWSCKVYSIISQSTSSPASTH